MSKGHFSRFTVLIYFLIAAACGSAAVQAADAAKVAKVAWEKDYLHAMDLANQQRKMLVIHFYDKDDVQSQRLENETLANPEIVEKLGDFICLRLPLDAKITAEGHETVLLQHPTLSEMLGRPGIAIADFKHDAPHLHGRIVSAFPLAGNLWYGPAEMKVILDLPAGSITQRTLIYAVRTHPERPASAAGQPNDRLLGEAESHSDHQARIRLQGHHGWGSRFPRISGLIGFSPKEVCAESWPGQRLVESAIECVRCWRTSPGHWSGVIAPNHAYGYDMKQGSNGVWYATGIFGG